MERKFRLSHSLDIQRVRRDGKSYAHPLFVLITLPDDSVERSLIGVIATKSVGGAVERNHAKRLLRASADALAGHIREHHMILLIARKRILEAESSDDVRDILEVQLKKADLYC